MKQLKRLSPRIQTKLILSFSFLIILQSVLQSAVYYRAAEQQIIANTIQSMSDVILKDSTLSDMTLGAILTSMKSYSRDPDLARFLSAAINPSLKETPHLWEESLYNRYFWDLEEELLSVHLVCPGYVSMFQALEYSLEDLEQIYPSYADLREEFGWRAAVQTTDPNTGEMSDSFCVIYPLSLEFSHESTFPEEGLLHPYIVVYCRPEVVYQYYESSLPYPGSRYFVTTQEGELVAGSPSRTSWDGFAFPSRESFARALQGPGSQLCQLGDEKVIVCNTVSEVNGWVAFMVVSVADLTRDVMSSRRWILLFNNTLSLAVLAAIYFLSVHFMRPMHELAGFARRISTGDFAPPTNLPATGDVGVISDTIQQMNGWVKQLMRQNLVISRREQEATIAALELQLNPHFLFNTLNSINLLAMKNGQKEISSIIVNLSGMMHYTLTPQNRFVQLFDELQFLEKYLYLMQHRSADRLQVEYEIEEAARSCVIPKMILQICVENAILHGIRGKPDGKIIIRALLRRERLVLQVEDNGAGMEAEVLRSLRLGKRRSVGVANINKRLKLLFGAGYGVVVLSAKDPTLVEISIPIIHNIQYLSPPPGQS